MTDTARTPILFTRPTASATTMTSPGLIDRSISRMIPAIRLPNVFCRPKPTASPSAPEKTAKAVRSMPSRSMPTKKAAMTITTLAIFSTSNCCVGSRSGPPRTTRRTTRLAIRTSRNSTSAVSAILMSDSSETCMRPALKPIASSRSCRVASPPTTCDNSATKSPAASISAGTRPSPTPSTRLRAVAAVEKASTSPSSSAG